LLWIRNKEKLFCKRKSQGALVGGGKCLMMEAFKWKKANEVFQGDTQAMSLYGMIAHSRPSRLGL